MRGEVGRSVYLFYTHIDAQEEFRVNRFEATYGLFKCRQDFSK